ncbi:MAG: L-threonylcarbamoyladenylate synthase, partial [Clostridia bacterium]
AEALFAKFSPGPLTIVLPKKSCVPKAVTGEIQTVGIRIPNNKLALELIEKSGCPIAAPSANASKRVSPTKAIYVYDDMKGRIPLILDGGECNVGIESTVLSLATEIPTILRPGGITLEMLKDVLPMVTNFQGEVAVAEAPGMKYTHYAPLVEECILYDDFDKAINYYDKKIKLGKKVVILLTNNYTDRVGNRNYVDMGNDDKVVAHKIFNILREAEKQFDIILVEKLPNNDVYYSVMNRLNKSTGGKILQ